MMPKRPRKIVTKEEADAGEVSESEEAYNALFEGAYDSTILTSIQPLSDESSLTPSVNPAQYDLEEGGAGMIEPYRKGKQSRQQMVTTSKRASILDPNPYG